MSQQKNHSSVTGLTLQRTKETFVDGWVRTGDKVLIKNAEIFVLDRLKVPARVELDLIFLTHIVGNNQGTRVPSGTC